MTRPPVPPDTPPNTAVGSPQEATTIKPASRLWHMIPIVLAASIATGLAYTGMVLFGIDVASMPPAQAYALAGFLEISLVAVALMARYNAMRGESYTTLITLTWLLSFISGVFAALHEIVGDSEYPYVMAAFRLVPPFIAAGLWHLALVGEKHMAIGRPMHVRRRERHLQRHMNAQREWRDALQQGRKPRHVARARRRAQAVENAAIRHMGVEEFNTRLGVWAQNMQDIDAHGALIDTLGTPPLERGTSTHGTQPAAAASVGPTQAKPQVGETPTHQAPTQDKGTTHTSVGTPTRVGTQGTKAPMGAPTTRKPERTAPTHPAAPAAAASVGPTQAKPQVGETPTHQAPTQDKGATHTSVGTPTARGAAAPTQEPSPSPAPAPARQTAEAPAQRTALAPATTTATGDTDRRALWDGMSKAERMQAVARLQEEGMSQPQIQRHFGVSKNVPGNYLRMAKEAGLLSGSKETVAA